MEHKLSKKEYEQLQEISSNKRAVQEMMVGLKRQMALALQEEDKWWARMAKKYKLDPQENVQTVNHLTQSILEIPRPQKGQPAEKVQPQLKAVPTQEPGITKRERTPEMNKLLSPGEIEAIKQTQEAIKNDTNN